MVAGELIDAESSIESLEQAVDLGRHPAQFAELESITMFARQDFQQLFQTLQVELPLGRKLEEHRPELAAQVLGAGENVIQRVLRVFELLVVRNEAAGLHREDKIPGRCVAPGLKGLYGRQTIKAVVQLQRIKVADVVLQHLCRRSLSRVKGPNPMLIVIAGGADSNVARHTCSIRCL